MSLLLHVSNLDNGVMIRCEGRIVCGGETEELETRVRRLLPQLRHVILELSNVSFIDSGGLGLLVRLMMSARSIGGDVKLASPSPQVAKLLEMTSLSRVFELFASPDEAVASLRNTRALHDSGKCVLCVDPSCDVLAFVRAVLQASGYSVLTADNLFDAKILLRASPPNIVLIGPNLDPFRAQKALQDYASRTAILALNAGFDRIEAAEAKIILLHQVKNASAA